MASFSLDKPGAKEYLIVGGAALGLFVVYRWWKGRTTASTPASSTAGPGGSPGPATPTGLSTGDFMAWIHDHTSTTTVAADGAPYTPGTPGTTSGGAGNQEIQLKKGRSLASLAAEYGVSPQQIRSLNPHLGARVPAGTKVRVPGRVAEARRG